MGWGSGIIGGKQSRRCCGQCFGTYEKNSTSRLFWLWGGARSVHWEHTHRRERTISTREQNCRAARGCTLGHSRRMAHCHNTRKAQRAIGGTGHTKEGGAISKRGGVGRGMGGGGVAVYNRSQVRRDRYIIKINRRTTPVFLLREKTRLARHFYTTTHHVWLATAGMVAPYNTVVHISTHLSTFLTVLFPKICYCLIIGVGDRGYKIIMVYGKSCVLVFIN